MDITSKWSLAIPIAIPYGTGTLIFKVFKFYHQLPGYENTLGLQESMFQVFYKSDSNLFKDEIKLIL